MITHYIGWDNGVSANGIALLGPDNLAAYPSLPTKKEQSYTKEKHGITRIDAKALKELIINWKLSPAETDVVMERPMVNPARFRASMSAMRALESSLVVLEDLGFKPRYVDSKEWQKAMFPGVVGSEELKSASYELGKKLYPQFKIKKDADSLLIAHWAMHKFVAPKRSL